MIKHKHYQLKIADFVISVKSVMDKSDLFIPEALQFFLNDYHETANIFIEIYYCIPEKFNNFKILFSTEMEYCHDYTNISPYNWCICSTNSISFINIYRKGSNYIPEIIAYFDDNAKHWEIFYKPSDQMNDNNTKDPFIYPLGPLILYYIANYNKALMIHSSGIFDTSRGYIFSGKSGVGKTTISKIWHNEKAIIINDDRLIIRKNTGKYYMYNTPMIYTDISKMAPLNYIFLLKQAPENYAKKLKGTEAIAKLMSNCIQHNYNKNLVNSLITLCTDICHDIPIYELGFVPDKSIVHFIRNYEFI